MTDSTEGYTAEYTYGKFHEAIRSMAVDPGPIQKRLLTAALTILMVEAEDLPARLRVDYAWIQEYLGAAEPVGDQGAFQTTLDKMGDNLAVAIAERIVKIEAELFSDLHLD